MKDTDKLLGRISNLISKDSTILSDYAHKIEKASVDKTKIEDEKKNFESNITNIQNDIDAITKVSELNERFTNLDAFMPGLEKLGDSCDYIKKLNDELARIPEKIEELENKINDLTEKSNKSENAIKEDEDELSKLDVELSDAKRYQTNLIDLIDLAKTGEINKTREEVVETLNHVGFSEKDAINAAKIILFPEDDLIPFFKKTGSSKKVEKLNSLEDHIENNIKIEETNIVEDIKENENSDINNEETKSEESFINNNFDDSIQVKSNEDIQNNVHETEEYGFESAIESIDSENNNMKSIQCLLEDNGYDLSEFTDEDMDSFLDVTEDRLKNNIAFLNDKEIAKAVVYKYPILLIDEELNDKYEYILNTLGKNEEDIKLNPVILVSYSYDDFKKLIDITEKTGIDPKDIPLMVYIKGLQGFLQNYIALKNFNIELDDNELSKFASILSINPVDFKTSLNVIKKYDLTLKKSNGKYAITCLVKPAKDLIKAIDMLIEVGESDLLKFYPEVLSGDIEGLVNRIIFVKKAGIPYKASAHGETVYQSYVLSQDKLEKIVEKKLDLNEIIVDSVVNNNIAGLIDNSAIISKLDEMNMEDKLNNKDNSLIKKYKEISEDEFAYIVDGNPFSKNKVNSNLNYLKDSDTDVQDDQIILASLFYNSNKSEEIMNKVISALNIKIG